MSLHLTKEQAIAEHRKMWNWIADETEKQKKVINKTTYLNTFYPEQSSMNRPRNNCFCCEYNDQIEGCHICTSCLIVWDFDTDFDTYSSPCLKNGSSYRIWLNALRDNNWRLAAFSARCIAALPISNLERRYIYEPKR